VGIEGSKKENGDLTTMDHRPELENEMMLGEDWASKQRKCPECNATQRWSKVADGVLEEDFRARLFFRPRRKMRAGLITPPLPDV
jgi:hypothetical protein